MVKLLSLCCVLAAMFLIGRKKEDRFFLPFVIVSVLALAVYVYRAYIFGDALFLYSTSDGFSQYVPKYMEFVRVLREGKLTWWTMSVGFGAAKNYDFIMYPMELIPVAFGMVGGELAIHQGFLWMQIVKMLLAAMFMFLFLRKLGLSCIASYFAAMIYGFCGIIIVRGHWIFLGDECYIAALMLYACELYLKDNKWYFIPPTVMLVCTGLGIYYAYLYALLLAVYATVRYFFDGRPVKNYLKFLFTCAGLYLLGLLMWSVYLAGGIWSMFNTERFANTTGGVTTTAQQIRVTVEVMASALFSVFDPSVSGVFEKYTGVLNYLERPLFYCGIVCLYLIPQAFVHADKKVKLVIAFGFAMAALYFLVTPVTDLFNAFIRNVELGARSYRMSSTWILLIMIVTGAYGLDCGLKKGGFSIVMLVVSGVLFAGAFVFFLRNAEVYGMTPHEPTVRNCFLLLGFWATMLMALSLCKRYNFCVMCWVAVFFAICTFEVSHSAKITVDQGVNYATEQQQIMNDDPNGYYSGLAEAMDYVKSVDDGMYRVSGVRPNVGAAMFCSPQYFSVLDTSYYTTISGGTYRFMRELYPESFTTGQGSKYSVGVGENLLLSGWAGYKYRIENNTVAYTMPAGYELMHRVGDFDVLYNTNALSLGVAYDCYIPESEFLQYSDEEQRMLLLKAVVVDDETAQKLPLKALEGADEIVLQDAVEVYEAATAQLTKEMLHVEQWSHDSLSGTVSVTAPKLLTFSIADISGWDVYVDGEKADLIGTNLGFFGVLLEEGEHQITAEYTSPGVYAGIAMSVIAVGVYICMILFRKKIAPFMAICD